jgi:hypothetical protein
MAVTDGQDADQTSFNNAFLSRTTDSDTVGKVSLANVDAASGNSLTNIQAWINKNIFYYSEKTSDYTIDTFDKVIAADGTSNTVAITLPAASSNAYKVAIIKAINIDNAVTIATTGGDTIDGEASYTFNDLNTSLILISDGSSDWKIMGDYRGYYDSIPFGPQDTDNSWRIKLSGTSLVFERRESGSWLEYLSLP